MKLYPLKFSPIIKEKIWGGRKLKTLLNKDLADLPNGGESWELSAVSGNVSVVSNGPLAGRQFVDIINEFKGELVGNEIYERFGSNFPLLIKFIDANDKLSIQVHPDDALAKANHNCFGKSEMWYILSADKDAKIVAGFSKEVTVAECRSLLESGTFSDVLANHYVKEGDVYYIPAGRIHAIDKGVLLAEIQQSSDITYRVYDYDRRDSDGKKRDLHVEQALSAINFADVNPQKTEYSTVENNSVNVIADNYFTTNVLSVNGELTQSYVLLDSFVILMCVDGDASIIVDFAEMPMAYGETVLIPASVKSVKIKSQRAKFLEVYVK